MLFLMKPSDLLFKTVGANIQFLGKPERGSIR